MGGHDSQAMYNIAVMEGVNEQLAAAKCRVCLFDAESVCLRLSVSVCMSAPLTVITLALSWH